MKTPCHTAWLSIVRNAALASFPTRVEAAAWLNTPSAGLGGLAPLTAAHDRGRAQASLAELDRLTAAATCRPDRRVA